MFVLVTGIGLQWWRKLRERSGPVEGSSGSTAWRRAAGLGIALGYGAYWLVRRRRNKAV